MKIYYTYEEAVLKCTLPLSFVFTSAVSNTLFVVVSEFAEFRKDLNNTYFLNYHDFINYSPFLCFFLAIFLFPFPFCMFHSPSLING